MRCDQGRVGKMQCNATLKSRDDMVQGDGGRDYREMRVLCTTVMASAWCGWWEVGFLPFLPGGRHSRLLPLWAS